MRRCAIVAVMTCAVFAGPAVSATNPPDYKKMIVKVGKRSVQATLGTYCHPTSEGRAECEEAEYPLKTTGRVTIRPNGTVQLLFGAKASHVEWRAARIDSTGKEQLTASGQARAVTRTFKRWRIRLPKRLSRTTDLLGFTVSYPYGFSSFEVGAKVARRR